MAELQEIPGIGAASLELLEVAGIRSAEHLAGQNPEFLLAELTKANESLSVVKRTPSEAAVGKWIASAIELVGDQDPIESESGAAVDYEGSEEAGELLAAAPYAVPIPGKMMMEKELRVNDVPAGILLNRYSGDLDIRVGGPERPKTEVPARRDAGIAERIMTGDPLRDFDASQLKSIVPEMGLRRKRAVKSKDVDDDDRVGLIRAPREKTNRGKKPESRRYVRGVLHTHPWALRVGAIVTLLLILIFPLAIASAFLLLLSGENPESFSWVPKWVLAFPIALPIVGFAYLIWGMSGKCRICTQKLFVHKGALKHVKAHRIPGLGYVIPLSLHLLLFSWFRCSSCGTPVRLKK